MHRWEVRNSLRSSANSVPIATPERPRALAPLRLGLRRLYSYWRPRSRLASVVLHPEGHF